VGTTRAAWALVAGWCALIFALSSMTLRADGVRIPGADKAVHACVYGVLGFLLARALRRSRPAAGAAGVVAAATVLATLYGASDEFHQSFTPGRDPSLADLAADGIGALVGSLIAARRGAPAPGPSPRP
jgi:VanZ family protein